MFLWQGCISPGQGNEVLVDDFEGVISTGLEGTVDAGSGSGSSIEVLASRDIKFHGRQSLKITFDAAAQGYMWAARGWGLDVKTAAVWRIEPKKIDFNKFNAIAFYLYGANTNTQIAVDLVDSGFEYWRYLIKDDFSGWKEFVIPLSDFFARGDWQPDKADKNASLDLPVNVFQFEPRPIGKGTIYVDYVRFIAKQG